MSHQPADNAFSVLISVRAYEIDSNGHVNSAVYLQYAEHCRWEFLAAAGVDHAALAARGVGPVFLETVLRYRDELRYPDTVAVTCEMRWGTGKTFRVQQRMARPDGGLVAEVDSVGGLIDLATRKLVEQPVVHYRAICRTPSVLGL